VNNLVNLLRTPWVAMLVIFLAVGTIAIVVKLVIAPFVGMMKMNARYYDNLAASILSECASRMARAESSEITFTRFILGSTPGRHVVWARISVSCGKVGIVIECADGFGSDVIDYANKIRAALEKKGTVVLLEPKAPQPSDVDSLVFD